MVFKKKKKNVLPFLSVLRERLSFAKKYGVLFEQAIYVVSQQVVRNMLCQLQTVI